MKKQNKWNHPYLKQVGKVNKFEDEGQMDILRTAATTTAHQGTVTPISQSAKGKGNAIFDTVSNSIATGVNVLDAALRRGSHYYNDNKTLSQRIGILANGGPVNRYKLGGEVYAAAAGDVMQLAGNAINQAQLDVSNDEINQTIGQTQNTGTTAGSNDELEQQMATQGEMKHISMRDLRHNSLGQDVLNGISAGNTGATAGMSVGGPWGAVIGGVLGTGSSILGSLFGRKKARRQKHRVNAAIDLGNARNSVTAATSADQIQKNTVNNYLRNEYINSAAEGGTLLSSRYGLDDLLLASLYNNKIAPQYRNYAYYNRLPVIDLPYMVNPYAYGGNINRYDDGGDKNKDDYSWSKFDPKIKRGTKEWSEFRKNWIQNMFALNRQVINEKYPKLRKDQKSHLANLLTKQMALESAYGTSNVSQKYNNWGGHRTKDGFKKYDNIKKFVEAHVDLLDKNWKDWKDSTDSKDFANKIHQQKNKGVNYSDITSDEYGEIMSGMKSLTAILKKNPQQTNPHVDKEEAMKKIVEYVDKKDKEREVDLLLNQLYNNPSFNPSYVSEEETQKENPEYYNYLVKSGVIENPQQNQEPVYSDLLNSITEKNNSNYAAWLNGEQDSNSYAGGGKIYINPKNKGKFTKAAKKAGMGVQEYANHVLANKDDYSSTLVKRANFARNAAKWHDNGGYLDYLEDVATANAAKWKLSVDNALLHLLNDPTYNYKAYYNSVDNPNIDSDAHWPDDYKTVYHPTFSDESIYSERRSQYNPYGEVGGSWEYPYYGEVLTPSLMWNNGEAQYAAGGELNTQGGNFSNGLLQINEGGNHEENPLEGVPMGADREGTPNVVEEGETIYDDYVFSKRLEVPEDFAKKYKLGKNVTFAEASKKLAKESEERPNDPISKRGLKVVMEELKQLQDQTKEEKHAKEVQEMYEKLQASGISPEELAQQGAMEQQAADQQVMEQQAAEQQMMDQQMQEQMAQEQMAQEAQENPNYAAFGGKVNRFDENSEIDTIKKLPTGTRKAGIYGNAAMVASDLLGLTNKPDYKEVNALANAASKGYQPVKFNPIGNYITYKPFDSNRILNKSLADRAAGRRAVLNNAGQSRGLALAGLTAADSAYTKSVSEMFNAMNQLNQVNKLEAAKYNQQTNQFNSQGLYNAAEANQKAYEAMANRYLQGIGMAMTQRYKERQDTDAAKGQNLTNLIASLQNYGKENFEYNQFLEQLQNGTFYATKGVE